MAEEYEQFKRMLDGVMGPFSVYTMEAGVFETEDYNLFLGLQAAEAEALAAEVEARAAEVGLQAFPEGQIESESEPVSEPAPGLSQIIAGRAYSSDTWREERLREKANAAKSTEFVDFAKFTESVEPAEPAEPSDFTEFAEFVELAEFDEPADTDTADAISPLPLIALRRRVVEHTSGLQGMRQPLPDINMADTIDPSLLEMTPHDTHPAPTLQTGPEHTAAEMYGGEGMLGLNPKRGRRPLMNHEHRRFIQSMKRLMAERRARSLAVQSVTKQR